MHQTNDALVLYLPSEAAKILRCSEWWIKEQARKGRIPYCWIGGRYKFTPDQLKTIARESERETASTIAHPENKQPRSTPYKTRAPHRKEQRTSDPAQLTARIPPRNRRSSVDPKAA